MATSSGRTEDTRVSAILECDDTCTIAAPSVGHYSEQTKAIATEALSFSSYKVTGTTHARVHAQGETEEQFPMQLDIA